MSYEEQQRRSQDRRDDGYERKKTAAGRKGRKV
jgi:hypothetical protein